VDGFSKPYNAAECKPFMIPRDPKKSDYEREYLLCKRKKIKAVEYEKIL